MGVETSYLYPPEANADFGRTESCDETIERWEKTLPDGGVAGVLAKLVTDIRTRRPRLVIADDPKFHYHGHNRALGMLVEAAARLAANPRVQWGSPHVVEEVLATATRGPGAISISVTTEARMKGLTEYPSQFAHDQMPDAWRRTGETFFVLWRARGTRSPDEGSVLASLLANPRR